MIAKLAEVREFVENQCEQARDGSDEIIFPVERYALSESIKSVGETGIAFAADPSITDVPRFKVLSHSKGMSAWAVILSVDLRDSSNRAMNLGAEKTYITMHTYLPTMAHLVEKANGKVVGLRGDGLFAAFGTTEITGTWEEVTPAVARAATQDAVTCGKAMIESVEDAINPILERNDIIGGLEVGVGIDLGNVVITRIGWESASEITAYGPAVNRACKMSGEKTKSAVRISKRVKKMYPTAKNGRVSFLSKRDIVSVTFPPDMFMLGRPTESTRRKKSR